MERYLQQCSKWGKPRVVENKPLDSAVLYNLHMQLNGGPAAAPSYLVALNAIKMGFIVVFVSSARL